MARRRMLILLAVVLLLAFMLMAVVPTAAFASSTGRRNTAIGISAFSLYQLFAGHIGTGLVTGAGAAYAWKRYNDSRYQHRYYNNNNYYRYYHR